MGQDELAKKLKVTKNYISLVENEKKDPSINFLKNAAQLLDIPLLLLMWKKIDIPKAKTSTEREIKKQMEQLAEKAQKLFAERTFKRQK
jgi:transcriptional regulator with XRE-family HTH domain